jgi:hypothetical protein
VTSVVEGGRSLESASLPNADPSDDECSRVWSPSVVA